MKIRASSLWLTGMLLLGMPVHAGQSVTDMAGRRVELAETPRRIVPLVTTMTPTLAPDLPAGATDFLPTGEQP